MNRKFRVLIVDDVPANIKLAASLIKSEQIEIAFTNSGEAALATLEKEDYDLILLDVMMPGMSGFEVCQKIKENKKTAQIPIIFLTAKSETENVIHGFELGAVDYVAKPFNSKELRARVNTHLELKRVRDELQATVAKLDEMSRTDDLTGLANRRSMRELLAKEFSRSQRTTHIFSVLIGDIDNFKRINDNFGHEAGDLVLKECGVLFKAQIREIDAVSRWGGEEFLFLLPMTDAEGAELLAERIRTAMESHPFVYKGKRVACSLTLGVATLRSGENFEQTIKRADDALYVGKNQGRNRVVSDSVKAADSG